MINVLEIVLISQSVNVRVDILVMEENSAMFVKNNANNANMHQIIAQHAVIQQ